MEWREATNEEKCLPIEYVAGDGEAFIKFVKGAGDAAQMVAVDGFFRWIITREDGTRYIARPENAK